MAHNGPSVACRYASLSSSAVSQGPFFSSGLKGTHTVTGLHRHDITRIHLYAYSALGMVLCKSSFAEGFTEPSSMYDADAKDGVVLAKTMAANSACMQCECVYVCICAHDSPGIDPSFSALLARTTCAQLRCYMSPFDPSCMPNHQPHTLGNKRWKSSCAPVQAHANALQFHQLLQLCTLMQCMLWVARCSAQ